MWEYEYLQIGSGQRAELREELNRRGADGWELVAVTGVDRTVGVNTVVAYIKRQIVGCPPPADAAPAWLDDPSGRYQMRWWDGLRWTSDVAGPAGRASDPPRP